MSAPLPLPRSPRYDTLDAWRGVACLFVVVFHAVVHYIGTPEFQDRVRADGGSIADWTILVMTKLWAGVPIFFVISGYCIAAAADSARRKPRSAGVFVRRRVRRIYPPVWVYLALTAAVVAFLPDWAMPGPTDGYPEPLPRPQNVPLGQWIGSLTLTEEWRHYLIGPPRGYFTGQLWTLCYEEQFYAVVAVIVAVARRWLFPAIALVTAAVFLNVADLSTLLPPAAASRFATWQAPLQGCFFDGLWLAFAAGVAVYYRVNYATPILRLTLDGFLVVGAAWAARNTSIGWDTGPNMPSYVFIGCLTALALSRLHSVDRLTATAPVLAPLRFCGRMCFSLYLVHATIASSPCRTT